MDKKNNFIIKIPGFKLLCGHGGLIIKTGNIGKIIENEKRYHIEDKIDTLEVTLELPGVSKENIEVYVSEERLYVKAKPVKKLSFIPEIYEFNIKLPSNVIPEESKASYENGILFISLTKKEKSKKIKVE